MRGTSEETFRALLDERGIVRPDALVLPDLRLCYGVFSQDRDARFDLIRLQGHADRFFGAKVGLTVDKRYGRDPLPADAARVVVLAGDRGASGTRLMVGRPTSPEDLLRASEAEQRQGTSGLAQLAHRCPTIWLVVPETPEDRAALTLAAILASVMLGPILEPAHDAGHAALFGVRTARLELERIGRAYR